MAERFAVPAANLTDTIRVDDMRPRDAALIEPLACVVKSLRRVHYTGNESAVVVGLGVMGLMHMLLMPGAVGYDMNPERVEWARKLGMDARSVFDCAGEATCVIICPGSKEALRFGLERAAPDARVCLFAPMPPGEAVPLDLEKAYFREVTITTSYSCGPIDTQAAAHILRERRIRAEQVVSHFIRLHDLPEAYRMMKEGKILKAVVEF